MTVGTDQRVGFVVDELLCLSVQRMNTVDKVKHLYTTRPLQPHASTDSLINDV